MPWQFRCFHLPVDLTDSQATALILNQCAPTCLTTNTCCRVHRLRIRAVTAKVDDKTDSFIDSIDHEWRHCYSSSTFTIDRGLLLIFFWWQHWPPIQATKLSSDAFVRHSACNCGCDTPVKLLNLNDVGRTEMNDARTSSSCASGREERVMIPRTSSYIFYILDT